MDQKSSKVRSNHSPALRGRPSLLVPYSQRLSVEVEAIRLSGALFDPYVAVLDDKRFELATSDDSELLLQDSTLSLIAPSDGVYCSRAQVPCAFISFFVTVRASSTQSWMAFPRWRIESISGKSSFCRFATNLDKKFLRDSV